MYDLAVIGGGSAGVTAAKFGPQLGARVAVIEAERMGGDCTWTGCIPSKTLIHAARVVQTVRTAERYGVRVGAPEIDFAAIMAHVQATQLEVYEHDDAPEVLRRGGAEIIEGRARFVAEDALEVNGEVVRARHFCVATGSHPRIPPIPGLAEVGYLTNETIFKQTTLPHRLLVVGGGPIGCELGQAFSRFGSAVTIVQRPDRLLPHDDAEMGATLLSCLQGEGIEIYLQSTVTAVARGEAGIAVTVEVKDQALVTLEVDQILVAAGRVPAVKGLGLDTAGILYDPERGIQVDDYLRTSNPRVFACGDVIGKYQFTHMAGGEAGVVLRNALFPLQSRMSYAVVPWVTFTDPEVAHAGLNEDAAREQYGAALNVYRLPWAKNDRARTEGDTAGLTKILTVGRGEKIVGAHIVGGGAGELIHELVAAMGGGISASKLGAITHAYPTRALGLRNAAQGSLLRWLNHDLGKLALRTYFRFFGA